MNPFANPEGNGEQILFNRVASGQSARFDAADRQPGVSDNTREQVDGISQPITRTNELDRLHTHSNLPADVLKDPKALRELNKIEESLFNHNFGGVENYVKSWSSLSPERQERMNNVLKAFSTEINHMKNGIDCSWSKTYPDSKTPSLEFDVTSDRKMPVQRGNKSQLDRLFNPGQNDVSYKVTRFVRFNTTPVTLADAFNDASNAPSLKGPAPNDPYVEYGTFEAKGEKDWTPHQTYNEAAARFRNGLQKLQQPAS